MIRRRNAGAIDAKRRKAKRMPELKLSLETKVKA